MNDGLTAPERTDPRLGVSQNPQTPGGQELSSSGSGLQNTSNLVNDSQNLQITSVGTSTSQQPAKVQGASTTAVAQSAPADTSSPYGIIAGASFVIIAAIVLTWFISRQKSYE